MAPLTGLVLTGLIHAGEGSADAVARGIAYLLDQQRADGTWPHGDWLQAIVPPTPSTSSPRPPGTTRSRRSRAGSR